MPGTREERAKARYEREDNRMEAKSEPAADGAAEARSEAAAGTDAAAPDTYIDDRKAMLDRHLMELRDARRQHAGEYRSILSRHDKETAEMMKRQSEGAAGGSREA